MPPKKKAAPAKSRLGPKADAGQGGIKAFFDVRGAGDQSKGQQAVPGPLPKPKLLVSTRTDPQNAQKENVIDIIQQQRAQKIVASKEAAKIRAVHARDSVNVAAAVPAHRVQTRNATRKNSSHMELILAEEYGQCSSQDILLGNIETGVLDGRVMWTASPGKGVLSTENPFQRISLSPVKGADNGREERERGGRDERRQGRRQRMEMIEPVVLPIELEMEHRGNEPDVFDALSTALNSTAQKRRESFGGTGSGTPRAGMDIKGTLGALKQCCDDLKFRDSPESSKKKRSKRVRRSHGGGRGGGERDSGGAVGADREGMKICEKRDPETTMKVAPVHETGSNVEDKSNVEEEKAKVVVGACLVGEMTSDVAKTTTEVTSVTINDASPLKWGDTESDDDEGGIDEGLDRLLAGLDKMTQSVANHSSLSAKDVPDATTAKLAAHLLNRYVIISCGSDGQWPVLVLRRGDGRIVHAHLQPPWDSGDYRPGDAVNLVRAQEYELGDETHCELGMGHAGFLVQFPELLLGSTRVTSSSECPRRGYLQEKIVSGDGASSAAAIYGQMYHQMIQSAMLKGFRKGSELFGEIDTIVESMPEALLDADIMPQEATTWMREKVPATLSFLNKFLRRDPTAVNNCQIAAATGSGHQMARSCITKVEEIEEYFVSPTYGLKGFIDVTTSLSTDITSSLSDFSEAKRSVSSLGPFEIKTGSSRPSDTAQVLLYLLALEEKYGTEVPYGMLFYLREREPMLVERNDTLLSCLLATRNTVAASLARTELPPMTHMKTSCLRCWDRSTCALVHASRSRGTAEQFVEGLPQGTSDRNRLKEFYELEVGHLHDCDKEFLAEWDRLLDLEAIASNATRGEIWTMPTAERERLGRCVASLALREARNANFATRGNNHVNTVGMIYTFAKCDGSKIYGSSITFGEPVLLSVEGGPLGVSRGHVLSISKEEIVVHTDKPIRTKCLNRRARPELQGRSIDELGLAWKVDKEEVGTVVPRMRGFLYDLFGYMERPEVNVRRQRLRRLIVGLEPPSDVCGGVRDLSDVERAVIEHQVRSLSMNAEQERALQRVFSQPGYSLVLGVPGSGKTTAIVGMINALASSGKRVLMVSYTNAAVDHVMLKLAAGGFENFLRLGRPGRVHAGLAEFLPSGERYGASNSGDMRNLMAQIPVVGVSALGVTDTLLRLCDFDVCIVDEAGQITLPSVMGALLRADKFVLVGDHNQLPPLVQSAAAEEQGLDTPLFARLAKAHPSSVVTLSRQYRMSEEIQSISNTFVYGGDLRCGTDEVARSRLIVDTRALGALLSTDPWMHRVLNPDNPVVFIDTGVMPHVFTERSKGDVTENYGEADMAIRIADAVTMLLQVPGDDVAIISPYRSQVALINDKLRTRVNSVDKIDTSYECLTIDKAQGRDKAMVIVSLVKSNDRHDPGKLLGDLRRVNVAMTRAQSKLVLIGDSSTLIHLELFAGIVRFIKENGWMVSVGGQ